MDLERVAWAVDRGTVFGQAATVRSVALHLELPELDVARALAELVAAGRIIDLGDGSYRPRRRSQTRCLTSLDATSRERAMMHDVKSDKWHD